MTEGKSIRVLAAQGFGFPDEDSRRQRQVLVLPITSRSGNSTHSSLFVARDLGIRVL